MSIAYVNGGNSGSIVVSPSSPFTFTLNVPASDLVCVSFRCAQSSAVSLTAVTIGGVSATAIKTQVNFGTNSMVQLAYLYNYAGNASTTFSLSYSGSALFAIGWADWFSGIQTTSDPFDTQANGTGGASVTTGTYSTAIASELAYGVASAESTSGGWSAGTGFTAAQAAPGGNGVAAFSEYQIYSSTQSGVTAGVSGNSTGAGGGLYLATFKGASAAAARVPTLSLLGAGL